MKKGLNLIVVCKIIIAKVGDKEVATYGNTPLLIPSTFPILPLILILPIYLTTSFLIPLVSSPKFFSFNNSN
jgi:hypothetical protein